MEHRQSPLDNEDKRRQNSAKKPSDASPSERLQKSRSSHFIGSGKNPHEMSNQKISAKESFPSKDDKQSAICQDTQKSIKYDIDRDPSQNEKELSSEREIREKQAVTTPSDVASDHSSTQDRNEKRQFSALEEKQFRQWSKSIPLDEYGYRVPKVIDLASISTRDKPILVGGMKSTLKDLLKWGPRERGGSSRGDQRSEVGKLIGQRWGNYKLVEYMEGSKKDGISYLVYRGEHVDSKELRKVKVPEGVVKLIGQRWGNYDLVEYMKGSEKDGISYLVYRGEHVDSKEQVEVKLPEEAGKRIGQTLGGYDLVAYLRDDSSSWIYIGEHTRSKKPVEVKVLKEKYKNHLDTFGRFNRDKYEKNLAIVGQFHQEIETLSSLNHPHIVHGLESYSPNTANNMFGFNDVDYLVIEYAPKGTLRDAYDRNKDSHWSPEKVVAMVNDLADASDYLHNYTDNKKRKRLLHMNLNPRAVLLGAYGQFLLSGFWRAKNVGDEASEVKGYYHGYVAPEVEEGRGQLDPLSDLYPLAVMAYEAFTGKRPFSDHIRRPETVPIPLEGIEGISGEVQQKIQDVIFKALAYDPEERKEHYENAKKFAEELEKACFGCIRKKRPSRERMQELYQEIAKHDEAISRNSSNVDAHYQLGKALSELGHDEEAVNAFEKATNLNLDPKEAANVYYQLGDAYSNLGHNDKAVMAFRKVVEFCNKTIDGNEQSLRSSSQTVELDESIRINQELAEAHYQKGYALYKLRGDQEAKEAFNSSDVVYRYLTRLFENHQGTDAAFSEVKQKHVKVHLNMGNALYKLSDFKGAVTAYTKAIDLIPNSNPEGQQSYPVQISHDERIHNSEVCVEAYYRKGLALYKLGNHQEEAEAAFSWAKSQDPKYVEAHYQEWNADLNCNAGASGVATSGHAGTVETNAPLAEEEASGVATSGHAGTVETNAPLAEEEASGVATSGHAGTVETNAPLAEEEASGVATSGHAGTVETNAPLAEEEASGVATSGHAGTVETNAPLAEEEASGVATSGHAGTVETNAPLAEEEASGVATSGHAGTVETNAPLAEEEASGVATSGHAGTVETNAPLAEEEASGVATSGHAGTVETNAPLAEEEASGVATSGHAGTVETNAPLAEEEASGVATSGHAGTVETNAPRVEEEATRLNLEHVRALYRRGLELSRLNHNEEAEQAFSEAINLNLEHADTYYQRGNVRHKLGKHDDAVADYKEATRLNLEHADAYYQMGELYKSRGGHQDQEKAQEAYDKYIGLTLPHMVEALYQKGNWLFDQGKNDEAEIAFRSAISLDPQHAEAHNLLGSVLLALGKGDEAEKEWDTYDRIINQQ